MIKHRLPYFAAAGMLLATLLAPAGAFAQGNGNSANASCTQATAGGGNTTTGGAQNNRANSAATVVSVVDVLLQDTQLLNNVNTALGIGNASNVQVVCLNDVLNQNDVRVLQDILNGSPITFANGNTFLNNPTINALNGVQVVAVDLTTAPVTVFLLR